MRPCLFLYVIVINRKTFRFLSFIQLLSSNLYTHIYVLFFEIFSCQAKVLEAAPLNVHKPFWRSNAELKTSIFPHVQPFCSTTSSPPPLTPSFPATLRKQALTSAEAGKLIIVFQFFPLKLLFSVPSRERLHSFCEPQQDSNNSGTSLPLALIKAACWLCLWMTRLLIQPPCRSTEKQSSRVAISKHAHRAEEKNQLTQSDRWKSARPSCKRGVFLSECKPVRFFLHWCEH